MWHSKKKIRGGGGIPLLINFQIVTWVTWLLSRLVRLCVYTHTHIYIHMYMYMYIRICTCICVCIYVYNVYMFHSVAVCCSLLQSVAVCCSLLHVYNVYMSIVTGVAWVTCESCDECDRTVFSRRSHVRDMSLMWWVWQNSVLQKVTREGHVTHVMSVTEIIVFSQPQTIVTHRVWLTCDSWLSPWLSDLLMWVSDLTWVSVTDSHILNWVDVSESWLTHISWIMSHWVMSWVMSHMWVTRDASRLIQDMWVSHTHSRQVTHSHQLTHSHQVTHSHQLMTQLMTQWLIIQDMSVSHTHSRQVTHSHQLTHSHHFICEWPVP